MEKFKVRVPIAGYVEIEVETDCENHAAMYAYNGFSNNLNPADGVTDLDAFADVPQMVLETANTVQVYLCPEDFERGIYTDYSLGVTEDEE